MEAERRYYRYVFGENSDRQIFYFHDPVKNKTTWHRPTDGEIYDGITNLKIVDDPSTDFENSSDTTLSTSSIGPSRSCTSPLLERLFSSCESAVHTKRPARLGRGRKDPVRHGRRGTLNDLIDDLPALLTPVEQGSDQFYVPDSIRLENTEPYDVDADLQEHMKLRKHGKMGKKRRATPTEVLAYNGKDSDIPLAKHPDKMGLDKKSLALWHMICAYVKGGSDDPISKIIEFIAPTPELIDEAFLQCCKLTRGHQNQTMIARSIELMLVMSTLFTTSPRFHKFVTHTLAVQYNLADSKTKAAVPLLAYLRFRSKHVDPKPPFTWVDSILNDPAYGGSMFKACLEEQMWLQRGRAPFCPIPVFLPITGQRIVDLKAREKQDLFKSSVYGPTVDALVDKVKKKEDPLDGAPVENLVPFLRRWIIELGRPIVEPSFYKSVGTTDEEITEWADRLPDLSRKTLKYLIGFLRYVTKLDWDTAVGRSTVSGKMGTLLFPSDSEGNVKQSSDMARKLFTALIEHWDVSDVYPIPDDFQVPEKLFD